MILGIDTDVLVNWVMEGTAHHLVVRRFLANEVEQNRRWGVTPQVLYEFLHICTDPRRFENPLSMEQAISWSRAIWDDKDVVRLQPSATVLHRVLELMKSSRLGRKRILDTALAATLESAGVKKVATLNAKDFDVFPFLETVTPEL